MQDLSTLINRPHASSCNLDQMPVRIAEIDALATALPRALLFHCYAILLQPCFPICQLRSWYRERDVKLAVAVMRRLHMARCSLLEQQQNLTLAGLHRAAALSEIGDHMEPKDLFVEPNGIRYVVNVK